MSHHQTPYIGSRISLISKLNIRYEGILRSVNPAEATLSLSKVRSFGTEDRPTSKVVLPRNDIFDMIIFKATDIKDLIICNPRTETFEGLYYDPAIVTISGYRHDQFDVPFNDPINMSAFEAPTHGFGSSGNQGGIHQPRANRESRRHSPVIPQHGINGRRNRRSLSFQQDSFFYGTNENADEKNLMKSDFDFEESNARLLSELEGLEEGLSNLMTNEKLEEGEENDEAVKDSMAELKLFEKADYCYDKTKSFFDSISCGTIERPPPRTIRPNRPNRETFGQLAVDQIMRGPYRHGPTHGGERGGRGRWNRRY